MLLVLVAALAATLAVTSLGSAAVVPTTEFVITGEVLDYPGCKITELLYPGITRCLVFTVQNTDPKNQITVTSLRVASVTAPAACPASNLDISKATWSGSVVIAKGKTAAFPGVPLTLLDLPANQDRCRNVTFGLTFSGSAINAGSLPTPVPSASPTPTPVPTPVPTPTPTPKPTPTPTPRPTPTPTPVPTPTPRPTPTPKPTRPPKAVIEAAPIAVTRGRVGA